jgi:hypothetical protein
MVPANILLTEIDPDADVQERIKFNPAHIYDIIDGLQKYHLSGCNSWAAFQVLM